MSDLKNFKTHPSRPQLSIFPKYTHPLIRLGYIWTTPQKIRSTTNQLDMNDDKASEYKIVLRLDKNGDDFTLFF